MRLHVLSLGVLVATTACYGGRRAAPDIAAAWRGHARVELQAELGLPGATEPQPDGTALLRWRRHGHDVTLPGGHLDLKVTPTSIDLDASARAGTVTRYDYELATALVDPRGLVLRLDGGTHVAGFPRGTNARTGVIMGLHGGLGRLDDAGGTLPGVGAYIGGMLGPRLALLGAYTFMNGKDPAGYAQSHAWGLALQYWPAARLALRAGPAMVIDTDPAPDTAALAVGAITSASFAVVRAGAFVLDVRLDATLSTASAAGMLGLGVHIN